MSSSTRIAAAALLGLLLCHAPAYADKNPQEHGPKHEKHQGKSHAHGKHKAGHKGKSLIVEADRDIIRQFLAGDYRTNCPPGLAKKQNGCLPPGIAKKRYVIGLPLPQGVLSQPLPKGLRGKLKHVPPGHRYGMVDNDVVLIAEATGRIVDAISLLSAVGQ